MKYGWTMAEETIGPLVAGFIPAFYYSPFLLFVGQFIEKLLRKHRHK